MLSAGGRERAAHAAAGLPEPAEPDAGREHTAAAGPVSEPEVLRSSKPCHRAPSQLGLLHQVAGPPVSVFTCAHIMISCFRAGWICGRVFYFLNSRLTPLVCVRVCLPWVFFPSRLFLNCQISSLKSQNNLSCVSCDFFSTFHHCGRSTNIDFIRPGPTLPAFEDVRLL